MENIDEKDKKTILIVDDEKPIVEILVYNLQKEGYNTLEANDGLTAVEIATTKKPDLILLDIMLPKMDGLTVCKKIRASLNVPILGNSITDVCINHYLQICYLSLRRLLREMKILILSFFMVLARRKIFCLRKSLTNWKK